MAQQVSKNQKELLELLETDRLQTLSVVANEVLARVKEPLELIRGRAETLKTQLEFYQRDNAQGILDQVGHLEKLLRAVESMLSFQTDLDPLNKKLKPYTLCEDITRFFFRRLSAGKIHLLNLIPSDLEILVSEKALREVLGPLVINAMEALEETALPAKHIFVQYQKVKDHHVISVEDNGLGLSEAELQKIFLPLSSRKQGHIGLSLAICRKICQRQNWELKAVSRTQQGTRIEIWMKDETAI